MSIAENCSCHVFFSDSCIKFTVKPWSHDWLIAAGAYPDFCSTA